jgi:hypothetical protein
VRKAQLLIEITMFTLLLIVVTVGLAVFMYEPGGK